MKRILASIGVVAVGASSLHAQFAPGLTAGEQQKLVTVSGTLRGFYDDNYLTQRDSLKEGTWGLEVSPSASLNKSIGSSVFSLKALYDLKHYVRNDINDHSVQVSGGMVLRPDEHQTIRVSDSFVVAQQPEVLEVAALSTPLRSEGSNIRNTASASYLTDLTKVLQVNLSYDAIVYHYQSKTRQPLLDRLEQNIGADLQYIFTPSVTGVLGYRFADTSYEDMQIGTSGKQGTIRNNNSHFALAGVNVKLKSSLVGSVRVGAQFFDYTKLHKTQTSPYMDASLTYTYDTGSTVQVGAKHLHNATDLIGSSTDVAANNPVLDAEATVAYVKLSQPVSFISPALTATLYGSFQHSKFNGGSYDGQTEDFYSAAGSLEYKLNTAVVLEAGYNYTQASSDFRPFKENRIYFGVRATY